ncbi:hypothetical protein lerEdw1_018069 [Lerista edwardsae]|nr:hypothetical protein lerEdw1_018069 [Lerista edwardsae]
MGRYYTADIDDVILVLPKIGQRETPDVILKEESAENMESKPLESTDKTNVDDEHKDIQDGDKLLPSPEEKTEEQGQPSESPSNDVGFKKVFKFVGFKFTVRKDKTEKSEAVQLLNVKSDDTEVASDGAGDHKEVKTETVEEAVQSEVLHPIGKTEQETQTEQMKKEISSEKVAESPVELVAGRKEAEVKSNGNKSPESPTSPLTNETASPLRKFFTQGWAGFRKKTSFRKPKEEEQQALEQEKQEQEQQQEKVAEEEATIKEELENEKAVPEKDIAEVSVEPSEEKVKKARKEREEIILVDASTETLQEEAVTPSEQQSPPKSTENLNKESEVCLNEKTDLVSEEKLEPVKECLIEQRTLSSSENEVAAPLATEVGGEKLDKSELRFPVPIEELEKNVEIVEHKSEPKAPLARESFDEIPTELNADVSTVVKKEDAKITEKELAAEQLVEADAEIQTEQATDAQLKVKETIPEGVDDQIKQIEPSSGDAATSKPPEGVTSEVELFSSHERAKMQGSPLKKLFTGTSLKKLSGKKHKGKREEAKLGEAAEQTPQLSDSAESPEDPKGESSASSPEEAIESVEKVIDPGQIPETEEGSTSDMEKKSITPWASFKKMVTPKKRVRRLSESDKEEELDKVKSATLSSTESTPYEELEDMKENGEEQKLEKSTEEPKRKVDTSVSWEALICVGSSKKRARKSSSSDEEVGQRLAQEGQKLDEGGPNKETAPDMPFISSQESDQGQGSSSPEQAGSPSDGDGVSTWESFKRLVAPRRKSKTRMEERNEESVTVPTLEHSTSDGDSGKEESWVSFKKLMPGRRKKKSDGIPEHAPVEEAGKEMIETMEEDSDVPAVVPLSEYEAAEREKFEAQQASAQQASSSTEGDLTKKKTLDQRTERSDDTSMIEQSNEGLVHAVTVTVVEGERAVTSIEERSPSWISAAVTESPEHAEEEAERQIEQISKTGIVEETVVKLLPEIKKDISGDIILSEMELTSEAITAREEASGVEEATEISCAEETTEMVSAVSRLTESPDTTEISTPVQEVEESQPDLEELSQHTQKLLQEVAERVKISDGHAISKHVSVEKAGEEITVSFQEVELAESPLKERPEKTGIQSKEGTKGDQSQDEVKESSLKEEELEKHDDTCVDMKGSSKEIKGLDWTDENKTEQVVVERYEVIIEEKSEAEEFVILTVASEEETGVKVDFTVEKQAVPLEEIGSECDSADTVHKVKVTLKETAQDGEIEDGVSEVGESVKVTCEEKDQLSQKVELMIEQIIPELESEQIEATAVEIKISMQNEVKDSELLKELPCTEVLEAPIQSKITEFPVHNTVTQGIDLDMVKDSALGSETENTEKVALEVCVQNKDSGVSLHSAESETYVQKTEPQIQLQKLEPEISLVNMKPEVYQLDTGAQIHAGKVETEIPIMEVEVEVHKQKVETEEVESNPHIQKMETEILAEKAEEKVDAEFDTEIAKAESSTEKAELEVPTEEAQSVVLTEKAYSKIDMEVHTEALAEKEDAAVSKTKVGLVASMEQVELEIPAKEQEILIEKAEAEVFAKKTDAMVHVEASTEKLDVKEEADESAEKGEVEASAEMAAGKLAKQAHAVKVDMESHAEEGEAEIAKKKAEGEVLVEKVGVEDSAEGAKVKTPVIDEEASAERSEGMGGETPTKQGEPKEILQKMEDKVTVQSEMDDSIKSLAKCAEVISSDAPVQTASEQASSVNVPLQDDSLSSESKHLDAVVFEEPLKDDLKDAIVAFEQTLTEEPVKRRLDQVSESSQDAVDLIQKDVTSAKLILKWQQTEGITAEAQESNELGDTTESKCIEEIVPESSVPKELIILPMKNELEVVKCMGITATQREKEDALTLEAESTEVQVTEDSVKKEAIVDSVKIELGSIPMESTATAMVTETAKIELQGDILVLDSSCMQAVVPDAILENKGESALPYLKSESKEIATNNISEQNEKFPDKLETIHPLCESIPDLDSCQRRQVPLEKTLRMETEKSTENVELACGDVLYTAPVQQDILTKQQGIVTTDIPEVQSCEAHKSPVAITAAAVEEQVISENVTLTETLQSLLEKSKEISLNMVQQVSLAHSGLGALGPDTEVISWSEKVESMIEEPALSAVRSTKDDLIQECVHPIPEVKAQQSVYSPEAEKKVVLPEKSPTSMHIEFEKDVVQSVAIESQSTKIVLKVIQNAVDKLEKTEEPESLLKQPNEPCLMSINKSEAQKSIPIDQQLPVKGIEEKNQEIQPSAIILMQSAEKLETFKTTEEIPLSSDKCEDGENWDSQKADIDLEAMKQVSQTDEQSCPVTTIVPEPGAVNETVKEIQKETSLQKENGKPKLESEVETQKTAVDGIVSRDLSKESLDKDQPKLKDTEAGQIHVQIHEQVIEQQTNVKRKEDHSQPMGFVGSHTEKDVNSQDYTTCESPQLKSELTES